MRTLIEVTWVKEGTETDPVMEKGQYWLWHFGLKYDLVPTEDGKMIGINYTVVIAENYDTGTIECFLPEQCRILGRQIKE